jgi:spoIIIJ-associated protein
MEWVETTGKTIEDATNLALDQLGVEADEAEVEVLDEPKSGLFGRVRSEARIRARVRPAEVRAKDDRRKPRGKKADSAAPAAVADAAPTEATSKTRAPRPPREERAPRESREPRPPREDHAPRESNGDRGPRRDRGDRYEAIDSVPPEIEEVGRTFLNGLLDSMGLSADIEVGVVNNNMIEFRASGRDLGVLIGPRAQTLQAIQELLRTVVHYATNSSSGRILLDVAGYREKRKVALVAFTAKVAAEVTASGERRALEPMSAADRKVIHDAIGDIEGVVSSSEGEDPNRYVVLLPE